MKIVYLYHSLSILGGLERVLSDKMNYLAENGFDIYFITCDQCGQEFSYPLSAKIHHHDLGGIRYHSIYKYPYPQRFWAIHKFEKDYKKRVTTKLHEIKPDIIIGNTSFNTVLIASLPYPCKKIVESHLAQPFTMKAGPKHAYLNKLEYGLKTIYDRYFIHQMKKYDELVVLTKQDQTDWQQFRSATYIPNPLTYFPDKIKNDTENKRIIAVGRLYAQKGFDLLAEAWAKIANKYPEWSITIYGDGNEKQDIEGCIKRLHIEDSFIIHPAISNITDPYLESDFLVLSSRAEGFGLVLIEAMSCGIPCVSFNCPSGPDEIITDRYDGLIAQNGNIDDLALKIEYMIAHEEERKRMGQRARISSEKYKIENIMQQWIELFNSLLKKPE